MPSLQLSEVMGLTRAPDGSGQLRSVPEEAKLFDEIACTLATTDLDPTVPHQAGAVPNAKLQIAAATVTLKIFIATPFQRAHCEMR